MLIIRVKRVRSCKALGGLKTWGEKAREFNFGH